MLLMLLLIATTAHAEQASYYPPNIQKLVNCMGSPVVTLSYDRRWSAIADEADKCLRENVAPALEDAGNANDLRAALKDFYLKALSRLSTPDDKSATTEFWTASRSVHLETKLAGLANEDALKKQP